MSNVTNAIARVLAGRVKDSFPNIKQSGAMVRVGGFDRGEIASLVDRLIGWEPWRGQPIKLVVMAGHAWEGLPPGVVVDVAHTATGYRNSDEPVVLLEVEGYSDRQGLGKVFRICDSDLLGGRTGNETRKKLTEEIWASHRGSVKLPDVVSTVVESVWDGFLSGGKTPPDVRSWASCLDEAFSLLTPKGAIDQSSVWTAVSRALPALRLFPDDRLPNEDVSVTERGRRIARNAKASRNLFSAEAGQLDDLLDRVETVEFVEVDGSPTPQAEAQELKAGFRKLFGTNREPPLQGLELRYWQQIEASRSRRLGLGDLVKEEIEFSHKERSDDLEQLDIVSGLNAREQEAAVRLMEASQEQADVPVFFLLSAALQKAVRKLAEQSHSVTRRPLGTLLREFSSLVSSESGGARREVTLERLKGRAASDDALSVALFAYVFGHVLREVERASSVARYPLLVEPALCDPRRFAPLWLETVGAVNEVDEEGCLSQELPLEPIRFHLRWTDDPASGTTFEWRPRENPGTVMLARLFRCVSVHGCYGGSAEDFDQWLRSSLDGGELDYSDTDLGVKSSDGQTNSSSRPESGATTGGEAALDEMVCLSRDFPPVSVSEREEDGGSLIRRWLDKRGKWFSEIADSGLEPALLKGYVDEWGTALGQLKLERCPHGNPDPTVEEFLSLDTWVGEGEEIALLATHPLRLRWVATHFEEMTKSLIDSLGGTLTLNRVNEDLFLNWIDGAAPRAHPPLVVRDGRAYLSVQEMSWHEVYRVVRDRQSMSTDWLAGIDDESVAAAVEAIRTYVDAYPHKIDGLHLLTFIRSHGRDSLVRILRDLASWSVSVGGRSLCLILTVFAPTREFAFLERALQEFDDGERGADTDFPGIQLVWHQWDSLTQDLPSLSEVPMGDIDLALVLNLFGTRVEAGESSFLRKDSEEEFDPWLDPTSVLTSTSRDGAPCASVSRRLLPEMGDTFLEDWSTVAVRQFRTKPVIESCSNESVDFLELRVPFAGTATFFNDLHRCAHWVVTLDSFVGRHQIEALNGAPEVIMAKSRLGSTGSVGLVVSSLVGRDFIVSRLARRLNNQLPPVSEFDSCKMADTVYSQARYLLPGVVLRAIGLGRTAQEIVGAVVSRRRVDEELGFKIGADGFEAWISLDEHCDWFGGGSRPRADLVRIGARWDSRNSEMEVEVIVLECKFRRASDVNRADVQITQSVRLFEDALATRERERRDGALWRREILGALRQLRALRGDKSYAPLRAMLDGQLHWDIPKDLSDCFLKGSYTLRPVRGVLCTFTETEGSRIPESTPMGHRWLTFTPGEIGQILDRLDHEISTSADVDDSPVMQVSQASPLGAYESHHLLPMYQRLIDVLSQHGVNAHAVVEEGMLEGPGFYVFRVGLPAGVPPKSVHRLQEELQYGLGLPAGLSPRSYVDRGVVVIEVPKEDSARTSVWAQDLWDETDWPTDALFAPIGVDARRQPVGINFSSPKSPHLLIGGMTGGGKSVALETILRGLTWANSERDLRLFIVDPKGTEFREFEGQPHLEGKIGDTSEAGVELLSQCVNEMDRRYAAMKHLGVRDLAAHNKACADGEHFPWWVAVLDEFADLTAEREARREIEFLVQRLAQKARACGIHVIVATQKPSADVISTTIRSNLGAQLALRVRSGVDSRVIMEDLGAESLAGNGDAFLRLSGEEKKRIQCAMYRASG